MSVLVMLVSVGVVQLVSVGTDVGAGCRYW